MSSSSSSSSSVFFLLYSSSSSHLYSADLNLRMLVFACLGCVGQALVVTLIKEFGIFVTTVTTTSRQFATVLLSFFIFPKPFSAMHGLACLLFFAGLATNIWYQNRSKPSEGGTSPSYVTLPTLYCALWYHSRGGNVSVLRQVTDMCGDVTPHLI